jgi:hypothetical protein
MTVTANLQWGIPITLAGTQLFNTGSSVDFAGPIGLNGNDLTIYTFDTTFSGSLDGSGTVVVFGPPYGMNLTGTSTFTGTMRAVSSGLNVAGTISNTMLTGNMVLSGDGTAATVALTNGTVRAGADPHANCCGDPHSIGTLSTGALTLNQGEAWFDIAGSPTLHYDQLVVTGGVELNDPRLFLTISTPPALGAELLLIDNDGVDAVSGTFLNYPEGASFEVDGVTFRISYIGGDGNDVVLSSAVATTTLLQVSSSSTISGQPVTLTATVASAGGTPTGSVRFVSVTTTLATTTLNGAGVAMVTIPLKAGSQSIVAEYQGSGAFASSTSVPQTINVQHGDSLLTLSHDAIVAHGDPFTIVANVTPVAPASGTPTGSVTVNVLDDASSGVLSSGHFAATLPSLLPGTYPIVATYGGDSEFHPDNAASEIEVAARASFDDVEVQSGGSNSTIDVIVTLSAPSTQTVRIDYETANGTAFEGADYVAASGIIDFAPGETAKTITLTIIGDSFTEPVERFRVLFSNPQHSILAAPDAIVTITDAAVQRPKGRRAVRS